MPRRIRWVRYLRTLMYLFFLIAGVFAMAYPTQVILTALQASLAYVWSGFLIAGGLASSLGSLRGRISGEIIGNPLLAASNAIFGGALFGYGQSAASIAIGCIFWGISFGLGARWFDVRVLAKISEETSNGDA